MQIQAALKQQYHSGLAMLRQCVERCPEPLWSAPNPPTPVQTRSDNPDWNGVERPFWRIAFHTVYFTHLYLGQGEDAFVMPGETLAVWRNPLYDRFWRSPWDLEPYELPVEVLPASTADILEYLHFVDGLVDATVDGLDLDAADSGFRWYPEESKIAHQLLNVRHLQGHVGQLSELLMLRGVDIEWV